MAPIMMNGEGKNSQVECAIYTAEQARQVLGLGRNTLYRKARAGEIPVKIIGRWMLFPKKALHEWLERWTLEGGCDGTRQHRQER